MQGEVIVVGRGTAGCPFASRLSAEGRHTVMLREAGLRDTRSWRNLRVADVSILPTLVSGNAHSPTILISEKAAAMIFAILSKAAA